MLWAWPWASRVRCPAWVRVTKPSSAEGWRFPRAKAWPAGAAVAVVCTVQRLPLVSRWEPRFAQAGRQAACAGVCSGVVRETRPANRRTAEPSRRGITTSTMSGPLPGITFDRDATARDVLWMSMSRRWARIVVRWPPLLCAAFEIGRRRWRSEYPRSGSLHPHPAPKGRMNRHRKIIGWSRVAPRSTKRVLSSWLALPHRHLGSPRCLRISGAQA